MNETALETATLAGGCFWCLEAIFEQMRGVEIIDSGYSGGHLDKPTYQEVCEGTTGHAEAIQVHFDPLLVSFRDLLWAFFAVHDPTTLDRQGNDVGTQYRSAIFVHSPEQIDEAEGVIAELNDAAVWDAPIVTEVTPFESFWPAEAYHREYYRRNPMQGYCQVVIAPKVAKFRAQFLDRLKNDG